MKFAFKFILMLESLVVGSIILIGVVSYQVGAESFKEKTEAQLESIVILKTNQLNGFITEIIAEIGTLGNYSCGLLQDERYGHDATRDNLENRLSENIPVIFVSASSDELAEKIKDLLGDDYIEKPYDIEDVKKRIDEIFENVSQK